MPRMEGMFAAAGWQVLTGEVRPSLEELFTRPGRAALRARIDEMTPEYQRLLRSDAPRAAHPTPRGKPERSADG